MQNTHITVWDNGKNLFVFKAVAEMLDLKDGQQIRTEKEFLNVLQQNATFGIATCNQMLSNSN